MLTLVIATKNKGKIKELNQLLKDLPMELKNLDDFENIVEVEETGKTFAENAKLKAESYAVQTNCWALADDSGLEVEALNNAPEVFSARYAGENSDDETNRKKLLTELEKTDGKTRMARFICAIAVSDAAGETQYLAEGICKGNIAEMPKGTNGFGYDSIFIPDNFENTFGELSNEIKQKISHRSEALKKIIDFFNENQAF